MALNAGIADLDHSSSEIDVADPNAAVVAPRHETVVIGVFKRRADAVAAVDELQGLRFADEQIGLASPQPGQAQRLANDQNIGTDLAEQGALAGAVTGASMAGLLALGAAAGAVPVLGPVLMGGLLASILTGAATGGITGGLVGALIGLGIPERAAQGYEVWVRQGCSIVTVRSPGRSAEASEVLHRHGAMRHGGIML